MKLLQILALTSLNLLVAATAWAQLPETCPNLEGWKPPQARLQRILSDHERWTKTWIAEADQGPSPELPPSALRNPIGRANLCNANLEKAKLSKSNLAGANLNNANLVVAELNNADLRWAELNNALLIGAKLNDAKLIGAKLNKANLDAAELNNADLHFAELNGASLREPEHVRPVAHDVIEIGRGAQLENANLSFAKLNNARLDSAVLAGAKLFRAELKGANLSYAILNNADLSEARLQRANLREATVAGAHLAKADLTRAWYAPVSQKCDSFVGGIKGLATVRFDRGMETGLVQLRELLQQAGLRDLERQATYAIESGKTAHAFFDGEGYGDSVEAIFRFLAFDLTTGYGLYPGFALKLIVFAWLLMTGVYFLAIRFPAKGSSAGIYQVWPSDRIETNGANASLSQSSNVTRLQPKPLAALRYAAYFSLLSAFHIGWRDLNVGTWITRIQPREYVLRATGWVRAVSGVQSLLSVYLLAMWALTYFGRPFQ